MRLKERTRGRERYMTWFIHCLYQHRGGTKRSLSSINIKNIQVTRLSQIKQTYQLHLRVSHKLDLQTIT